MVYSSFGYFHGDTREREAELTAQNNDSLSCETNQSQRFQMNGQKIAVVVLYIQMEQN